MSNNLFLDISSSCTGYCIADDKGTVIDYGAIWFPKVTTEAKCKFIYDEIEKLCLEHNIELVVYEQYSFNTSRVMGALVLPHLIGAVMVLTETLELQLDQITPQTWRKQCGIKPVKTAKKARDYKIPTEAYFRALYDVPEKIESNITGKLRTAPNDLFDAMGVCEGYCKLKGLK